MQRIQSDDAAAERGRKPDELAQIAKVAHAPVAFGAQRIELHRNAPDAFPAGERRGFVAALRGDDHAHLGAESGVERERQRVITQRPRRQFERQPRIRAPICFTVLYRGERGESRRPVPRVAVFKPQRPPNRFRAQGLRRRDGESDRTAFARHDDRRRHARPARDFMLADRAVRARFLARIDAHRRENRGARLDRHLTRTTAVVEI